MQDPDIDSLTPEELADSVVALPEWDRLLVRNYYDHLTAEVLHSKPPRSEEPVRTTPPAAPTEGVVVPLFPRRRRPILPPDSGEAA